jgi:hypothetical protein
MKVSNEGKTATQEFLDPLLWTTYRPNSKYSDITEFTPCHPSAGLIHVKVALR